MTLDFGRCRLKPVVLLLERFFSCPDIQGASFTLINLDLIKRHCSCSKEFDKIHLIYLSLNYYLFMELLQDWTLTSSLFD